MPKQRLPMEIWALIAGAFSVALGYGVVAPALPQLAHSFNVSFTAASGIVSAFALMRLLFAPAAGWIVQRLGERLTYMTGILIVAASTGACAIAATFGQLLILRGLGGVGSVMFSVATSGLLIRLAPVSERGRVSSLNAAGFLLGNLLGPVMGGVVAGFGLRAPFVLYFFTLIIACAIVGLSLRNSSIGGRPNPNRERTELIRLPEALQFSQYRAALITFFTTGWSSFGVRVATVPLFIGAITHDPSAAAWVLAGYAAGNAIFILPSGRWNDRFGRKPLMVVGGIVGAVGFILLPQTNEIWFAILVMALTGAGSAFTNPAQQATLADVVGYRNGGQVISTAQMAQDLGGVLGPLVVGLVVDSAGFSTAFIATGALMLLTAGIWLFTPDSRRLNKADGL
ncbi:MAG: MFS transporter [Canibacter sp.]